MNSYLLIKPVCFFLLSIIFFQNSDAKKITRSVRISCGAVNGVFIEKNGKNLVVYGDPNDKVKNAEMVLFTHFRRDAIWAGRNLVQKGSLAVVPAAEKSYFTKGDSIWGKFITARFHDYNCQTTKIGIFPFKVCHYVQGGDILNWQGIDIEVFDTPGFTRGSVSYIADIDGKRFAFVGDMIYGDGKVFDLYSFQDSVRIVGGYHGYAVRLGQLVSSLQLIAGLKPDFLIPERGPVINDPVPTIQKLIQRIQSLYRNYLTITANRFYHPDRMNVLANHVLGPSANVNFMPFSSVIRKNPPPWYMHISNSNLVFAEDSSAFLIDCGTKSALEKIVSLRKSGRLKGLDGVYITHYHDDHTDFINDIAREFGCPVYITGELKEIIEHPASFHMPCLTTWPVSDLTIVQNGQKMFWKDFTLTFNYFPGQTLYHDAVLFEKSKGESIFFIGDSFTPSGIDDYCLLNRNMLHPGMGYFYCLDFLKKLPQDVLLANQHVEPLFAFSRQQLDYMTNLLIERNNILKDLFPWDDINYGIDEQWVNVYPYYQKVKPGQILDFSVKIFNHSGFTRVYALNPVSHDGFNVKPDKVSSEIESLKEDEIAFKIMIPEHVLPGIYLLMFNIKTGDWDLREWSEAIIEVLP